MFATKKIWSVLTIALVLGLGTGCDNGTSPADDVVYSYNVEEIAPGIFGYMSPTMTIDEWCLKVTGSPPSTYDQLMQAGFTLYKDENLETPFSGSDIIDESTVIYCASSINGQGKKIGEITGTITLTDIPHPATTKVYISCFRWGSKWWSANRKIDISEVTGTSATLNWSLPVYESFGFDLQSTFQIIVLLGDLLQVYTVPVPTGMIISGANANVGDLGTVSVKGVTLSGTIIVTHNGQPVPYVEIHADFPGWGRLGSTSLYSPEPNTPWSITFGPNSNDDIGVEFQVVGYSEKNGTFLFLETWYATDTSPVRIVDNHSVSGIVLDVAAKW